MTCPRPNTLARTLRTFFFEHLPTLRGLSPHTIHSYRDSLVLLLRFVAAHRHRAAETLDVDDLSVEAVTAFLAHLERERHTTASTRNVRLAAIHAFVRFLAAQHPEHLESAQRLLGIPFKRTRPRAVEYLEYDELAAVLAAVDRSTRAGRRDYALLATMFNTMVAYLREAQQELTSVNLALNERNQTLEALSSTDVLTGLHNRRRMRDALNAEVARHQRNKRSFSIMMVDVDHFKKYNDTYGHPEGDVLLKKVGEILKSSLRTNDFAARYGGEEFLILLPDQDQKGAVEVAERIRQRIAEETKDEVNNRKPVTASLGVATFPESGRTADSLLANADAALYRAKNNGRNRVLAAGS